MLDSMQTATDELLTFEVQPDETLLINALDDPTVREIYQGREPGRYAVVRVDDAFDDNFDTTRVASPRDVDGDPDVGELRVIGRTTALPETGTEQAELRVGGETVVTFDARGLYGLLWVPMKG